MGGGGDDVHANATCAFVDLIPVCSGAVHWWGVGGWGGGGDDVHANALCLLFLLLTLLRYEHDNVAPCWPCCKVTFETLPVAL